MDELLLSAENDVRLEADGVVSRPSGAWSASVAALLTHLRSTGFSGCPEVVSAVGEDGRHRVRFVEGDPANPRGWNDEGIWKVGQLLREMHEASALFAPPADALWQSWYTHRPSSESIISHADTGPWNVVAKDGLPVAWVDWDFAGPVDRLDEVAETARLHCQLHGDDVDAVQGLLSPERRAEQLRLFADAYGLETDERARLVSLMAECGIYGAANDADESGITPSEVGPHPMVWGIAWQARGGRWLLENRPLLDSALGI